MTRVPRGGFTLIELVVTLLIVGLLAGAAVPLVELTVKRNKERELRAALREIRSAIDAYKRASDEGRILRLAQQSGYPPKLVALVEGVPDVRSPERRAIYFLRRLPRDPTFPDQAAPAEGTWGKRSYASPPQAPEEGDDVFDVYSRTDGNALNGTPYKTW
ncbi:MAG: type II secretion system protein [Burkholderiales bacterium]